MSTTPARGSFADALVYATEAHRGQTRNGWSRQVPYISHPLAVCAIVQEDGGSEAEAKAALLHDLPEDQGGLARLNDIRDRFGDEVADIVLGCTDTLEEPRPVWKLVKAAHLQKLRTASPAVLRVARADKLHNARCTLRDLEQRGGAAWSGFRGGRAATLPYYEALVSALGAQGAPLLQQELARVVAAMAQFTEDSPPLS